VTFAESALLALLDCRATLAMTKHGVEFMKFLLNGIAALAATAPAVAQPPVPPTKSAPQVWQLDWQDNHCTISTGDAAELGFAMWITPGDPRPDLYFIGSPKLLPHTNDGKITVTLMPAGESFSATVMDISGQSGAIALRLLDLPEKFPAEFARSTEVGLAGAKEPVRVTGSGKAVSALRQCIDEKLPEWGVDPKAYEALRSPPTDPSEHLWFTDVDYPQSASMSGDEGDVIARMDVDATGSVTNCAVVVSSGSKPLDDVTCSTALRKGKFNPAIGADGQPSAGQRIVRVVFRLQG
jgi:TonB family protein